MKKEKLKVVKGYRTVIPFKEGDIQKRVMIGIPMTGVLRAEWVLARYGQVIPCNWSQNDYIQWIDQYSPMRFMVADARNIVVQAFVEGGFEWLFFIDHDVVLPPLFFVTFNQYMLEKKVPIVTGLYWTKSVPSEPLIYRGRGNSYFKDWKIGDKVWVDGHGMGCTLIHGSILKLLYEESPEYQVAGKTIRKVFETPTKVFYDPESNSFNVQTGTEDLEFLHRIIKENVLARAGWKALSKKEFPFLVDTRLFCWHIREDGTRFPSMGEHQKHINKKPRQEDTPWFTSLK